nr:restriction endonuclease subunit S [Megasphaera sp. ASD88]
MSWEQRKLGDECLEIIAGGDVDKIKLKENGKYPVLANALSDKGIVGYYDDYYRVKAPAVTVTGRGDVGHAQARKVNFTPVVRLLSLTSKHDVDFLAEAINQKDTILESTGIPQLTVPKLASYRIYFPPTFDEELRIGKYFSTLDNLITLHQRKYFNAMNIKKIALLKFFSTLSHEIYRQFTNSWEQRKAKELFVATADKGHPELPVLSATQDRGMIRRDENSINVYHDKKNEAGYKRVLPGQFVIHLRSFQGGFAHSTIEGITSPAYTVFDFSDTTKHDSEYWKHVFTSKEFIQRLETVTYGIRDGRSISYNEFLTMEFIYPSKKEQTEIARYLNGLDTLITLHQHENLKGGLL